MRFEVPHPHLAALRLAIYTGARHREEILWAPLSWCRDLDGAVPRIGVPRAKGDRGARQGRWIYLGPAGRTADPRDGPSCGV